MIGLDTNVLLAWVLASQSRALPVADTYRITHVVLAELVWVLSASMKYKRTALREVVEGLLNSSDLVIDKAEIVRAAFTEFEKGKADFADFLIGADNAAAGCLTTVTLDRKAARESNFTLLQQ